MNGSPKQIDRLGHSARMWLPLQFLTCLPTAVAQTERSASEPPRDRQTSIDVLVKKLTKPLVGDRDHKVAVLNLTDIDGNCSALGRFLADKLTTGLGGVPGVVVERRRLRQVAAEMSELFAFRSQMFSGLGQSLGSDSVVVDTMTHLVKTATIYARIVSTGLGRRLTAASSERMEDVSINSLLLMSQSLLPFRGNLRDAFTAPAI